MEMHSTNQCVFCFDSSSSRRKKLYPEYKANRKRPTATAEEERSFARFRSQLKALRTEYLPAIGFRNVFMVPGFEADDLIASITLHSLKKGDRAIIVSSDSDLYQLLNYRVAQYDPNRKKTTFAKDIRKRYGIPCKAIAMLDAIAGDPTDNIKGVPGVGPVKAAQYLNEELKTSSKAFQAIRNSSEIIDRNYKLTALPFRGTPILQLQQDVITRGWHQISDELGLKRLKRRLTGD
jgi:DNA polymerase-1